MKLVKLFRTPNAYYAFDAPKGKVIEISKETYAYLEHNGSGEESVPDEFLELRGRGFFSGESPVKQISHLYTRILDVYLERRLDKITLQVTQQCNFRCSYCVYSENLNHMQRSHSNRKMDFSVARKAIDFLREHAIDSPNINIGFYGGEPLLNFDLVRQVIEYSKNTFYGKELTFNLTTNGSLLEDDVVDYMVENKVSLMISLDGPKSIHDRNRKLGNGEGTYDLVMARIQRIRDRYPEYWENIQYSMVMDPMNDFAEITKICKNEIIVPQNLVASLVDRNFDEEEAEASEEYIENSEYSLFLAYLAYWKRYPKEKVATLSMIQVGMIMEKLYIVDGMVGLRETDIPSGPCIPGAMRTFVDVDGQIFPCERVSEQSEAMRIGHIDSGFEMEKVRQLLEVSKVTEDSCKECWAFRLCDQCAKTADTGMGELLPKARLHYCQSSKAHAYSRLQEYILAREVPAYYKDQVRNREEHQ